MSVMMLDDDHQILSSPTEHQPLCTDTLQTGRYAMPTHIKVTYFCMCRDKSMQHVYGDGLGDLAVGKRLDEAVFIYTDGSSHFLQHCSTTHVPRRHVAVGMWHRHVA